MRDTAGEAGTNSLVMFFHGPLHMVVPVLTNQQKLNYNTFVRTQDVVKTCRKRWMIGLKGKNELKKSVLAARHEDQ